MNAQRTGLPAAFFGHGSPMNTLDDNMFTRAWRAYGAALPRPRAILVISAHWYVPGTRITAARRPRTIHDFNLQFPPALAAFEYPAPGDPEIVERVVDVLRPLPVEREVEKWGIDHGAFSVLAHLFPAADVPVVELAIDRSKPPAFHYELGARLAPLRDAGVFVMGSGNIVHNLELGDRSPNVEPYDWAMRFNSLAADLLAARDHEALVDYHRLGPDARRSVPTPDHYLPLLYVAALQRADERIETIVDGFAFRSGSMLSVGIAH